MTDDRFDGAGGITRTKFLKGAAGVGVGLTASGLLVACGDDDDGGSSDQPTGGTLRLGTAGGSVKDTLEPQYATSGAQQSRLLQLYESLMVYDQDFKVQPWLAEELTAESPTRWIVKLRDGVVFHDGSPLEAEDVIFSLRRILEPEVPRSGRTALAAIDPKQLRAVDKLTVEINLQSPTSQLPDLLAEYYNTIVPRTFDIKNPVGTGPFSYGSYTPGQESRFASFADYWHGKTLVDEIVIVDLPDSDARTNAIIGGQVDVIDYVPFTQADSLNTGDVSIVDAPSGFWYPIVMRASDGPLADPKVRLALKLIADRPQFVENVVAGHGTEAYDLYSPFDPVYAKDLATREQDIEQAKSLLKEAGSENLSFTLTTADTVTGMNDSAAIFAEQAKAAGVNIRVDKTDVATLYGENYGKWVCNMDVWGTRNYLSQVAQGSLPDSPFNTSGWSNERFASLYEQASAELDDEKRKEIAHEMQQIERDEGPNIIPMFPNAVAARRSNVEGIREGKATLTMGNYDFRETSVSS